ncbi:MAG: DinB family protein [Gemmatimonadetes bacterium]|nr:DinB family protein [Gemmatimonadota bacterium]MBK9066255.1 DinB family protein [Gemmatimonadota bacterium]
MRLDSYCGEMRAATAEFLATLEGASRSEWGWKPAPDRWSVYEIAEHTCTVQRGVERLFSAKLLGQPLTPDTAQPQHSDEDIARFLAAGGRPVRAPEMVNPKGRWSTREEIAQVFTASTEAQIAWVEAHADTDLRRYGSPHPMLGMLDGVQWMILLAAHARRHAQQVREVRAQYAATGG